MPLVVLGLSHRTAPPEVRNRHAFPPERVTEALAALRDYEAVREAAIVSTCNRLEIYADVDEFETGIGQLKDFLTTYRAMRVDDFDKYLYTLLGAKAAEQLFRVASGLDSMLIGEAQIIAQVKEALVAAERAGTVGVYLHRLFRMALETGKRVRTETAIARDVTSLGAAAVELASRHCDLRGTRALVIGAGKMGTTVAKHLAARGAAEIAIANRTLLRAQELAGQIGAVAGGLDELPKFLESADLIITSTGGGDYIIGRDLLRVAFERRAPGPLLIVDIAAPRDVEPAAGELPDVTLYELGDLRQVVEESLTGRRCEIPAAETIVDAHVGEYVKWYHARAVVPLIATLRHKAEVIRSGEVEKLFSKLPELSQRDRELIVTTSVAIVNKLLHAPLTHLREAAADAAYAAKKTELFGGFFDLTGLGEQLERQLNEKTTSPAPASRFRSPTS